MRLGSSLKRRRRSPKKRPAGDGRAGVARLFDPENRTVLGGAAVAVGGLLLGYLFATRLLFPAPAPPGDLVEVPDVTGQPLQDALQTLDEAGLRLDELGEMLHPAADSGTVVGQAPLAGQLARPGHGVRLTVSLGSERRRVPPVVGLRGARALDLLEATGLTVAVDSVEGARPRGEVLAVDPAEGTEVTLPSSVRLSVSLGPPLTVVPDLGGLTESEARDSLAAIGLDVLGVEEVFRFGRDQGRVVGQEPAAGVEVERGGGVRLQVGRRGGRNREQ